MEKKSDREIIESAFSPEQLGRLEKLLHDIYQSHVDSVVLGYRLAESSEESKYRKLVEGLKLQLNTLYFNIPTGTVDAFEMIKLVKNHYESLESLITEIEGGDNGKAEG